MIERLNVSKYSHINDHLLVDIHIPYNLKIKIKSVSYFGKTVFTTLFYNIHIYLQAEAKYYNKYMLCEGMGKFERIKNT